MAAAAVTAPPAIVPEFVYRDARAAIALLERAFGFVPGLIVPDEHGNSIAHAELWAGNGCVMLGSAGDGGPWSYRVPAEIGGVNTGSPYLATSDIAGLHARAVAAGCTIVSELSDTDYGSRDFSALDREGFLWHFGTYRPGETAAADQTQMELFTGGRYVDARAAITWLANAFGAQEQLLVSGAGDDVAHAQLQFDGGIFMLGSYREDRFNLKSPRQVGGAYTQTFNVWVADPDAHHARAAQNGAEIVAPPADTPYGARGYVARDCEGYVWSFSTYRPAPRARVPATGEIAGSG